MAKKERGESLSGWDIPSFDSYKGKIVGWASYWPMSVLAFVVDEPIRKIVEGFWHAFGGMFRKIYDGAFADLK